MLSLARSLSLASLIVAGPAAALELPLPPPGEDIVGQIQVIKAKYEDTFADIATANDLGYLEMVAANPGVDAWLPGEGAEIILPTRYILPPGPREGIVINLAEYRMYYFPKGQNVVHTFPLGIGREGWGSPIAHTTITAANHQHALHMGMHGHRHMDDHLIIDELIRLRENNTAIRAKKAPKLRRMEYIDLLIVALSGKQLLIDANGHLHIIGM